MADVGGHTGSECPWCLLAWGASQQQETGFLLIRWMGRRAIVSMEVGVLSSQILGISDIVAEHGPLWKIWSKQWLRFKHGRMMSLICC